MVRDFRARFITTDAELREWNRFVLATPCASFFATSHWLDSYISFGITTAYMMVDAPDTGIMAGAALTQFRMGPLTWLQVIDGPIAQSDKLDAVQVLVSALEQYARSIGAAFIQIAPFEAAPSDAQWRQRADEHALDYAPDLPRDTQCGITALLMEQGYQTWPISTPLRSLREGQIVSLDTDDLLAGFRKGTRRDIRYTLENDSVAVQQVTSLSDLEVSYQILVANALEQAYPIRPWNAFKKGIWPSIENETAFVLLMRYENMPCATAVVALGGKRAAYVMGGTLRLHNNRAFPAHLLQFRAMEHAQARGMWEYDLTSFATSGVAKFKRGFRPQYYRLVAPQIKVFRPLMFKLFLQFTPLLTRHRRTLAQTIYRLRGRWS